jgi:crotonobetainyl-CoA:carnitine CoA-transferase CaiB-like acyl-CoA transferase
MQAYEGKKWDEPAGPDAVGWSPLQRLYRAADGWLFLGASKDNLAALAKLDGLAGIDALEGAALASALEAAIASKPADEWVSLLASADAGAQKVVPAAPLMHDPWVIEHGLSVTRTHKGGEVITTIGPPPRLSRTPVVPGIPVSKPGADALEVLMKAGLADRLDDYVARKIVVLE